MRKVLLCGAAAIALCAPVAADAQVRRPPAPAPAPRSDLWSTSIYLLDSQRVTADTPRVEAAGYIVPRQARDPVSWIRPEDVPEDLRRRAFAVVTIIELEIDAAGRITACNPLMRSEEPRLLDLACRLAAERLTVRPMYVGPGRPVASRWKLTIAWQNWQPGVGELTFFPPAPIAPPPPPPPGAFDRGWPRLGWSPFLAPIALPPIQSLFPAAARRGEGKVSLDLLATPQAGITGCSVAVSSGDPALDEAACRIARTLDLRYRQPCEYCSEAPLPLQVVWNRRGGSHIRLPLLPSYYAADWPNPPRDPADSRTATRFDAAQEPLRLTLAGVNFSALPPGAPRPRFVRGELQVSAQGRATRCTLSNSTGDRASDVRLCRMLMRRPQPARTDVFGDPAPGTRRFVVELTEGS